MAYNETYDSEDVAPIVIDTGSKVLVGMATFATVIGLIAGVGLGMAIYKWAIKKK